MSNVPVSIASKLKGVVAFFIITPILILAFLYFVPLKKEGSDSVVTAEDAAKLAEVTKRAEALFAERFQTREGKRCYVKIIDTSRNPCKDDYILEIDEYRKDIFLAPPNYITEIDKRNGIDVKGRLSVSGKFSREFHLLGPTEDCPARERRRTDYAAGIQMAAASFQINFTRKNGTWLVELAAAPYFNLGDHNFARPSDSEIDKCVNFERASSAESPQGMEAPSPEVTPSATPGPKSAEEQFLDEVERDVINQFRERYLFVSKEIGYTKMPKQSDCDEEIYLETVNLRYQVTGEPVTATERRNGIEFKVWVSLRADDYREWIFPTMERTPAGWCRSRRTKYKGETNGEFQVVKAEGEPWRIEHKLYYDFLKGTKPTREEIEAMKERPVQEVER